MFDLRQLPHHYQVMGVLALTAAIYALCRGAAERGFLDLVATFSSAFTLGLVSFMAARRAPEPSDVMGRTRSLLASLALDFEDLKNNAPVLLKALMAFAYAIAFLVVRRFAEWMFTALSSPWLAACVGLGVASLVLSPVLWRDLRRSVSKLNTSPSASAEGGERS